MSHSYFSTELKYNYFAAFSQHGVEAKTSDSVQNFTSEQTAKWAEHLLTDYVRTQKGVINKMPSINDGEENPSGGFYGQYRLDCIKWESKRCVSANLLFRDLDSGEIIGEPKPVTNTKITLNDDSSNENVQLILQALVKE